MKKPIACITGGASGIGFGISMQLAEAGFDLALCGRRVESELTTNLDALREAGAAVFYQVCDVSCAEDRAALVAGIREQYGALHCLVNNAGVAPSVRADLLEATEESFERVMKINLQGPYFLTQAVANWMVDQAAALDSEAAEGEGTVPVPFTIVNVGSISGEIASPSRGEYCLSKAAMSMMTKLFAVRLADAGILVYEIQPGVTKSGMTEVVQEKYDQLLADGLALQRRWGTPEDNGKAVVALATGMLPYSTGAMIPVDGGLTVPRL